MADIGLCEQVAVSPDLSFAPDAAEFDIWLQEQFPNAPLSCYQTQLGIRSPAAVVAAGQPILRPILISVIAPLLHF